MMRCYHSASQTCSLCESNPAAFAGENVSTARILHSSNAGLLRELLWARIGHDIEFDRECILSETEAQTLIECLTLLGELLDRAGDALRPFAQLVRDGGVENWGDLQFPPNIKDFVNLGDFRRAHVAYEKCRAHPALSRSALDASFAEKSA